MHNNQSELDTKNAEFWDELCGSGLAQSLGITEVTPKALQRFDKAYMEFYPYLSRYVLMENIKDKKVLEIGLGYGSLGQVIIESGSNYYGLDIAIGPVLMMQYRLRNLGKSGDKNVKVGSALDIPFPDEYFDYVYSIGCLHHTGNVSKSIDEVYRILKPGGKTIIMLYNRHSFRQLVQVPYLWVKNYLKLERKNFSEMVRSLYDVNVNGKAAPHIDYVSLSQARYLFRYFSRVRIDVQNFDSYALFGGMISIQRDWLLSNVARVIGLDLYITATK